MAMCKLLCYPNSSSLHFLAAKDFEDFDDLS